MYCIKNSKAKHNIEFNSRSKLMVCSAVTTIFNINVFCKKKYRRGKKGLLY